MWKENKWKDGTIQVWCIVWNVPHLAYMNKYFPVNYCYQLELFVDYSKMSPKLCHIYTENSGQNGMGTINKSWSFFQKSKPSRFVMIQLQRMEQNLKTHLKTLRPAVTSRCLKQRWDQSYRQNSHLPLESAVCFELSSSVVFGRADFLHYFGKN